MELVVLPTPPFWFAIAMTFVNGSTFRWTTGGEARVRSISRRPADGHPGYPQGRDMPASLCKDDRLYSKLSTVLLRAHSSMVRASGS